MSQSLSGEIGTFAPAAPDWQTIGEEVLCPLCRYNLRGLVEPRCPECGYGFSWAELLDPERRLHPYLFEHHPERNVNSFFQTMLGGLRPRRFWKSLRPSQPSNVRRLLAYGLIIQFLVLIAALLVLGAALYVENAAARRQFLPMRPWGQNWMFPSQAAFQTWLDQAHPLPPSSQFFLQVLARAIQLDGQSRPFGFLLVIVLAWPWMMYLTLMVFEQTMRAHRIDGSHVVRCVIYSHDIVLPTALLLFAFISAGSVTVGQANRGGTTEVLELAGLMAILAMLLISTYRLAVAYRSYLNFRHAVATVLLSEVVVALASATVVISKVAWWW